MIRHGHVSGGRPRIFDQLLDDGRGGDSSPFRSAARPSARMATCALYRATPK